MRLLQAHASSLAGSLLLFAILLQQTKINNNPITLSITIALFALTFSKVKISIKKLIWVVLLQIIIFIHLIVAPYFFRPEHNDLGKFLKLAFITTPLCFSYENKSTSINLKSFIDLFILISLASYPILYLANPNQISFGYFDLPRFSGFFADPNFFAIITSAIFLITRNYPQKKYQSKTLLFLIVLTQSMTAITLLVALIFLDKRIKKLNKSTLFLAFSGIFTFYFLFIEFLRINLKELALIDENAISLKVNSLLLRFRLQINAFESIENEDFLHKLYGFGSGISSEIFGQVLHNQYIQAFFDHGYPGILLILILIYLIHKSIEDNNATFSLIYLAGLSLDLLGTLTVTFISTLIYLTQKQVPNEQKYLHNTKRY